MATWGANKSHGAGAGASLADKLSGQPARAAAVRLERVKLDGLVLLKIIKHCSESLPELVMGSILGLDAGPNLEVTNSFAFPTVAAPKVSDTQYGHWNRDQQEKDKETHEAASAQELASYQQEMFKLLRDVNVDCNQVGWYRAAYMGSFCNANLVNTQFMYQEMLDQDQTQKSVVLIFDPFQSKRGNLALKAYRLSDAFCKMYRERKQSGQSGAAVRLPLAVVQALNGLSGDGSAMAALAEQELSAEEIFEELPIEITNAHLFTVLIDELKHRNGDRLDVDFDRLNLSTNAYLSANLEFLVDDLDQLNGNHYRASMDKKKQMKVEQDMVKWIQTRRLENAAREERGDPLLPEVDPQNELFKPKPIGSQLETLLLKKQIGVFTQQVNRFSGAGFSKLYLAGAIQGKKVN
jgi:translation initiation factor 3 subunit H